jgi:hypothetical protein
MNAPFHHHHLALSRLADPRLLRENAYIGGRWTAGPAGAVFDVPDPASGRRLARVASLGPEGATLAVDAAARAFLTWKALLPQERAETLRAWHGLIKAAREDLALLMTLEQGKPLAESRGEIDYAASFVAFYAEEGMRLNAESVTSHLPGAAMMVSREPVGVAALLTPWNFPSAMLTRKAAAALAAGCTVVAHPSSYTPLSALALAELGERAGLPAGVFNIVTGHAEPIAARFCADERVRVVSFTGSTEIGRVVAERCAPTVKRLVMELGGHAPLIVFDDADLARAVDIAVDAKFATSGQDCLAANRIYVQHGLYPAFCEAFAKRRASPHRKRSSSGLALHAPDPPRRCAGRGPGDAGGDLRARGGGDAVRHRGRGRRPRERDRVWSRRLCRDEGRRAGAAPFARPRVRHGRGQPGQDHRRADTLRRRQAVRNGARRLAARDGGFHGPEVCLPRFELRLSPTRRSRHPPRRREG